MRVKFELVVQSVSDSGRFARARKLDVYIYAKRTTRTTHLVTSTACKIELAKSNSPKCSRL